VKEKRLYHNIYLDLLIDR